MLRLENSGVDTKPKLMTHKSFCEKIAKQAGQIIRQNFHGSMKKVWKSNATPVTKTDIAINRLVIKEIKKYFSGQDVLGEEQSHRKNRGKMLWVCDPVDGTIPFSHGVPTCVFSLALVNDGRPILGVIYDPFMDRLVYAEKGKGATLNGKKIRVNKQGMKRAAYNWESGRLMLPVQKKFPGCFPFRFNSFIYGSMLVATGELVASLYTWKYAHDAASVKIIVEEAGGKVTDMYGREQRYDRQVKGCLVSNGLVHDGLVKVIRQYEKGWETY